MNLSLAEAHALARSVSHALGAEDKVEVAFEGPGKFGVEQFDRVLVSVGRAPNGKKIGADKAGVTVTERGFIPVDVQMRTNQPHIFAIGDIVGGILLAHKAAKEARIAVDVILGEPGGKNTARTKDIAEALRGAGFEAVESPFIEKDFWVKLLGNVSFNPVSALTLATANRLTADEHVKAYMVAIMRECLAIGRAVGVMIRTWRGKS